MFPPSGCEIQSVRKRGYAASKCGSCCVSWPWFFSKAWSMETFDESCNPSPYNITLETNDHVRSTHFGALFGRCVTSDRGPFALEGPTSFDRGTNWTGRCCCQSLVALAPGWPKGRRYSESESLENGRFMGANPTSYQIKEGVGCSHISKVNLVAHVPCQSRIISHCWHFDHRWCQVDLSVRVIKEKTRALFDWLRRIRCTLLFTSVCKLMLISSSTYWFGTAWKSIGFFLCFAGAAKPVCKKKGVLRKISRFELSLLWSTYQ